MAWFDFFWTAAAIAKIEEHGLTTEEVEYVVQYPEDTETSRRTDRLIARGVCYNGKYIAVAYEMIDKVTVMPVTAFMPEPE